MGNRHAVITPYESFSTKDGAIIIAIASQSLWEKFRERIIQRPALTKDTRFLTMADRNTNQPVLKSIVEETTRTKTSTEWIELLETRDIPCGYIRTVGEAVEGEYLRALGMVLEKDHPTGGEIRLLGNAVKLSDTPVDVSLPPPLLDQHTDDILKELGYSNQEIEDFRRNSVV